MFYKSNTNNLMCTGCVLVFPPQFTTVPTHINCRCVTDLKPEPQTDTLRMPAGVTGPAAMHLRCQCGAAVSNAPAYLQAFTSSVLSDHCLPSPALPPVCSGPV